MPGQLKGSSVFVEDRSEASRIYSKGCFGFPLSGGSLELDLIEAAFLMQHERLEVFKGKKKLDFSGLFEIASSLEEGFDIRYLVYSDLRSARGFIVKPGSGGYDFRVYARGEHPSDQAPAYLVVAASVSTATDFRSISGTAAGAEDMGKKLLYAVADEEGDITYYRMSALDPKGIFPPKNVEHLAHGSLVGDRVFVYDGIEAGDLRKEAQYGKFIGDMLQLSLVEACYLSGRGMLEVRNADGDVFDTAALRKLGRTTQEGFGYRLKAYSNLRKRGLLVKAGFKYGTHFRLYERDPDECHAKYLAHAVPADNVTVWPEISRIVRLSGGVRKEILFCRVGEGIEYLSFKWFRP